MHTLEVTQTPFCYIVCMLIRLYLKPSSIHNFFPFSYSGLRKMGRFLSSPRSKNPSAGPWTSTSL